MKPHRCPDCHRYGLVLYNTVRFRNPERIRAFRYYKCTKCGERWKSLERLKWRVIRGRGNPNFNKTRQLPKTP